MKNITRVKKLETRLEGYGWSVTNMYMDAYRYEGLIDIMATKQLKRKNYLLIYKDSKRAQDYCPLFHAIKKVYKGLYDRIYFFSNGKNDKIRLQEVYRIDKNHLYTIIKK